MQSTERDRTRRPASRAGRTIDRVVTVLLLVVTALAAVVLWRFGALIGMQADVCAGEATCDFSRIDVGVQVVRFAPAVVLITAAAITARRWRRGLLTSPVPLIGLAMVVAVVLGGDALIGSAITMR